MRVSACCGCVNTGLPSLVSPLSRLVGPYALHLEAGPAPGARAADSIDSCCAGALQPPLLGCIAVVRAASAGLWHPHPSVLVL